jgi:hypothetical protein
MRTARGFSDSNGTPFKSYLWFETLADVVEWNPLMTYSKSDILRKEIVRYKDRPLLIGSFTDVKCNGIYPPYHELAEIMHQ